MPLIQYVGFNDRLVEVYLILNFLSYVNVPKKF